MTQKNKKAVSTHPRRGLLLSVLVIPVGIAAWAFLWQFGFIASVVSWGIAAGAVWLYKYGSHGEVTKATLPWLLAIILIATILAFLSGIVSDLWSAYVTEIHGEIVFLSTDFWAVVWANLTYGEFLTQYIPDFLISVAFSVLGAGGTVYGLFRQK